MLISGIKTYIQLLGSNSPSSADAKNNRDHTCKAVGVEIEEIIRVLQLTSAGEDDIEADDAAILKNVLVSEYLYTSMYDTADTQT